MWHQNGRFNEIEIFFFPPCFFLFRKWDYFAPVQILFPVEYAVAKREGKSHFWRKKKSKEEEYQIFALKGGVVVVVVVPL